MIIAPSFSWTVNRSGHRWVDINGDHCLTEKHDHQLAGHIHYQPFRDAPALFRTFADLVPTEDDVVRFANRYGLLGTRRRLDETQTDDAGSDQALRCETMKEWANGVAQMREAVTLWDASAAGDLEVLREYISIERNKYGWLATYKGQLPGDTWAGHPFPIFNTYLRYHEHLFMDYRDDLPGLARLLIAQFINDRLVETTSLHLELLPAGTGFEYRLELNQQTLLSVLWLQLTLAIGSSKEYRRCRECGNWMELDKPNTRSSRTYCSSSCRNKAFRKRQDSARKLQAEGRTLQQIAYELETDTETVRGWLGNQLD